MAFGKVFESLFTGSMVGTSPTLFAVWTYCIANSKPENNRRPKEGEVKRGFVEINPNILAVILGTTTVAVEDAIETLCSPDPKSRSTEHDGRRLITEGLPEFTYELVTFGKYDAIKHEEHRRKQNREAKRRQRASSPNDGSQQCQPTETETETGDGAMDGWIEGSPSPSQNEPTPVPAVRTGPESVGAVVDRFMEDVR